MNTRVVAVALLSVSFTFLVLEPLFAQSVAQCINDCRRSGNAGVSQCIESCNKKK